VWNTARFGDRDDAEVLEGADAPVEGLALSRDSRWLAAGTADGSVVVWDLHSKQAGPYRKRNIHSGSVFSLAIAPSGRWVISSSTPLLFNPMTGDNTVRLWDVASEGPSSVRTLLSHDSPAASIRFLRLSEDAKWLAAQRDQTVFVWRTNFDSSSSEPLESTPRQFKHEKPVMGFTLVGHQLVTSDFDGIYLWDLNSDHPARSRRVIPQYLALGNPALSRDGNWLADQTSSGGETHIRLWSLKIDDLLRAALDSAGRSFTAEEKERYLLTSQSASGQ
jgi:WD40 repeat protein